MLTGKAAASDAIWYSNRNGKASKASSPKSPARTLHEAPLAWLRRRRDRDGQPLISIAAGEAKG